MASTPASISLTFNENIGKPAYVAVRAPDGTKVAVSNVSAVNAEVTAALAPSDQKGRYTATYRVVSADGHPVEGTIRWTTTAGRAVKHIDPPEQKHQSRAYLFWGVLAAAVVIGLLRAPLRRPRD